jgi:hypothetical protein
MAVAKGTAGPTLMPFKVTVVDRVASGSMVLTFHEIQLNPALRPEELAHIIPERFCCNRRNAATISLAASFTRPAGGLAPHDLDVLTSLLEAKDLSARIRSKRAVQAKLGMYLLGRSGLRVPISRRVSSVSLRTVRNEVGSHGRPSGAVLI